MVRGLALRHTILSEIANSKQIRVIEHSNKWDDIHAGKIPIKPNWTETVYATVILTPIQTSQLEAALSPARDYGSLEALLCIFEPHHRIEIQRKDHSIYSIEICFICGQLSVNGQNERIFPVGWGSSLSTFISSLSLHPNGPWDKSNTQRQINLLAPDR